MPHHIEAAPSARAKCRACKRAIPKGDFRLGVAVPNAFGEGEAAHWFHMVCGAERRSAECQEALEAAPEWGTPDMRARLLELTRVGIAHPRWTRPARVERATTGRAKCRHCREAIAEGTLRIQLEFVEDGMINPAGFLHPSCALSYVGTTEFLLDRLQRTSELSSAEVEELGAALALGSAAVEGSAATGASGTDTSGAQAQESESES